MSKWEEHKKKFKELSQSEGIGIKEYCARFGLQYNTARRYLKLNDQIDDQFIEEKRAIEASKQQKEVSRKPKSKRKSVNKQSDKIAPEEVITNHDNAQQSSDQVIIDHAGNGGNALSSPLSVPRSTRFKRGITHNYKNGLYALPKYQDIAGALELIMEPENIPLIETETVTSLLAQKALIERMQNQALVKIVQDDELARKIGGAKKSDGSVEDDEDPTPIEFKMLKIVNDVAFSLATVNNSIAAIMDKAHVREQKYRQLSLKERDARVCSEAYAILKENDDTIAAAMYIESMGVKVPATLMLLVQRDIQKLAESAAQTGAVSQDLEKMARAYAEKRKEYADEVRYRPEEIEKFLATQGYEANNVINTAGNEDTGDGSDEDRDIVSGLYGGN